MPVRCFRDGSLPARWMSCVLLWLVLLSPACAAGSDEIRIVVGGLDKQVYLPAVLASRLGYFREQGLSVSLLSESSGVDAEDELLAGAVEGVVGFYDHAIDLQAKGKRVKSLVQFASIPGEAIVAGAASGVLSLADLRGRNIGVTGLGSSTAWLVSYLAGEAGVARPDFRLTAVGAGDSFIQALRSGRVAAGMTTDPTASRLLASGGAVLVADLRTAQSSRALLGGPYPAACLYVRERWMETHTQQARQLAAALVRALAYLHSHTAAQVAEVLPPEYLAGGRAAYVRALERNLEMFTTDGRMPEGGPANVLRILKAVDPHVQGRPINLAETYTDEFLPSR